MQEPTHILTGVIIQKTFQKIPSRLIALVTSAVVAFLSHGFLDNLARITFHPADPDFHSVFWVSYHTMVLVTTIVFLVLWWRYWWGIFFAALADVDWIFIHSQQIFNFQISFYREPHIHHLLGFIWSEVPPFSWATEQINRLPNYRHNPLACLWEVLLVSLMLIMVRWLKPLNTNQAGKSK
jgi:hypothetical protein